MENFLWSYFNTATSDSHNSLNSLLESYFADHIEFGNLVKDAFLDIINADENYKLFFQLLESGVL